jgi:succinate dehydrogenase/fumarate reductase flavoprotein subunit
MEKLAEKIKAHPDNHGLMNAEVFCRSVSNFNAYCAKGEDLDFHREPDTLGTVEKPPFYAMALFPGGPNTKGGLKANEKRQVVNWDGNVIPRLYAAGEIASVFKNVYQAGGNIAECIVFGRIAGLNAAGEKSMNACISRQRGQELC